MAICSYCLKNKELRYSHSVPNALFRLISKRNSGKLISISSDEQKNHYTAETGDAQILCEKCENDFNKKFDSPFSNAIKRWDKGIVDYGFGYKIDHSPSQITQALAAIFWRASVSGNILYDRAKISQRDRATLRSLIDVNQDDVLKHCSCMAHRLYDRNRKDEWAFTQECISQIILPAVAVSAGWGGIPRENFGFAAIMQGFLFVLVIPRLPFSKRSPAAYFHPNKKYIHAPTLHFLDFKPLADMMVTALRKELEGHSTLKRGNNT